MLLWTCIRKFSYLFWIWVINMAKKKKYKKLTNKEKEMKKQLKKQLQEEGILPPDKKRLNRRKYAEEVIPKYKDELGFNDIHYVFEGIEYMLPYIEGKDKITPEQVGVLKALDIALKLKAWDEKLRSEGKTEYKVWDRYNEVIVPIKQL